MTAHVTSADGTPIAFDRLGEGPPVIVIGGMFNTRKTMRPLAGLLSNRFTVINYDRRGRGDSGDTSPYAVDREIDDVGALIEAAGGQAAVYGHSSGAGLALLAAAAGLPIARLVLHEPPYGDDAEESRTLARELALDVRAAIAEGRRSDAIRLFFEAAAMPPHMVERLAGDPDMQAVAPTMPYDFEVMGDVTRGGTVPIDLVRDVRVPTLVLVGSASPPFFADAAHRIAELLPDGTLVVLGGEDHAAPAHVVARVVGGFLAPAPTADAQLSLAV